MIAWDVCNGLARRSWARNHGARFAVERVMSSDARLRVTLPYEADEGLLRDALAGTDAD
jgi:urocanate hydratase